LTSLSSYSVKLLFLFLKFVINFIFFFPSKKAEIQELKNKLAESQKLPEVAESLRQFEGDVKQVDVDDLEKSQNVLPN